MSRNHTKRAGKLSKAKFCPFCGVDNIERDYIQSFNDHFVEFICLVCGQGWRILESRRVQTAQRLFKAHREMRVPTKESDCGPDQFAASCRKQFRAFKHELHSEVRVTIGHKMKEWLAGPEAQQLREHYGIASPSASPSTALEEKREAD